MLVVISKSRAVQSTGLVPLGEADFVNGSYTFGLSNLTAADVIDHTDWITASGIEVPGSDSAGAQILGGFADLLLTCEWTISLDVEVLGQSPRSVFLTVANAGSGFFIELDYDGGWEALCTDGDETPFAFDYTNSISNGVHRLAVTRIDNKISLSVDGNAVVTDSTPCILPVPGFDMVNAYLGGWSDNTERAVNIRALRIYEVQPDDNLPVLSAI